MKWKFWQKPPAPVEVESSPRIEAGDLRGSSNPFGSYMVALNAENGYVRYCILHKNGSFPIETWAETEEYCLRLYPRYCGKIEVPGYLQHHAFFPTVEVNRTQPKELT